MNACTCGESRVPLACALDVKRGLRGPPAQGLEVHVKFPTVWTLGQSYGLLATAVGVAVRVVMVAFTELTAEDVCSPAPTRGNANVANPIPAIPNAAKAMANLP